MMSDPNSPGPVRTASPGLFYFRAVLFGLGLWLTSGGGGGLFAATFATNTIQFSSYSNRTALVNGGWSFWATNVNGIGRNTEITDTNIGPRIIYKPVDNPAVLRIPADTGLLLGAHNDTRNSLFRNLATNWTSLRLRINFAPTQSFQEASLAVYQDDDNYVQVGHSFSGNERVRFTREFTGVLLDNYFQVQLLANPLTNIHLRLDRDPVTDRITGLYSVNGVNWTNVGNFSQSFANPRLAIVVGGSATGFPNCDLIRLDVITRTDPVPRAFAVPPQRLVFNMVAGQLATNVQAANVALQSLQSAPVNWTLTNSAPTWLATSVTNGTTPYGLDVFLKAAATNLAPGTYEATVGFRASGVASANINVTLIVNPTNRVRVATWQGGKQGAMTVSTDDSKTSGYFVLLTNGFQGSFMLMQGPQSPVFTELHENGMELGAHSLSHPCMDVGPATIRGELEGNLAGILATTPMPAAQLISLAWPCGVASVPYQIVAADYFLSARGYNFNQLEEPTPYDFMNLKSYNSHGFAPEPPADLKTVVDAAETQGKWFNLVLHNATDDDGAISYAASKNVWVASLGAVIKYVHQRDRTVITNYTETANAIQFNTYRLPLAASAYRSFETAFDPADVLTFQVDVTGIATVSAVFVGGVQVPFATVGDTLLFQTLGMTNAQIVVLDLTSNTAPVLTAQDDRSVNELTTLVVTNIATDADFPTQMLSYSLVVTNLGDGNVQTNAQITANGIISWTPTELQGPGNYAFTTEVTDFATPPLRATNTFIVTVHEINTAPILPTLADVTMIGMETLTVTNTATDADRPANALGYRLTVTNLGTGSQVMNASISADGVISWTPVAFQVPSTNLFTTVVTDTNPAAINAPNLHATNTFVVTVQPYPLQLPEPENRMVNEQTTLVVTNTALLIPELLNGWLVTNTYQFDYTNRAALLADGWSFLATNPNGTPRDSEITNASLGVVAYAQANTGLGTVLRLPCDQGELWQDANNSMNQLARDLPANWVSARVRLAFAPLQNYMQAYLVLYQDDDNYIGVGRGFVNGQKALFIEEVGGTPATLTSPFVTATELSLRLDRNFTNDVISAFYSVDGNTWESLGETSHSLTNARLGIWTGAATTPYSNTLYRCDLSRLDIIVTNETLSLDYTLAVTNTADNSVVGNANITSNGIISWTPEEIHGPGVYTFSTAVTDGLFNAQHNFTVTVSEVNLAPVLTLPGETNILPLMPWSVLASAADADLPANALTFELVSGPAGLGVAPDGLISWTPAANQGSTTNAVAVRVFDSNPAAVNATSLSVTSSFDVVVAPVPGLPILLVTANNTNRTFTATNPGFTASFNGFLNGDDPSALEGALQFSTAATNGSAVGLYPLQVSGVSSSNYNVIFVDGTLTITPAAASVGFGGLNQTYDGTGRVVTPNTAPGGLNVNVTYAGSLVAPTNVGSYEVIGTIVENNFFGSATNTLTVNPAAATVLFAGLSQVFDGTARVVTAITTPVGLNVAITYEGSGNAPTNVGSYVVIGTIVETNYVGSATNTLTVNAETNSATVILNGLSQVYDGTARVVTASTVPEGLNVALTYDGNSSPPTNAGTYAVIGSVAATNYTGSATNTLIVAVRPLSATAQNVTRLFGQTNPMFAGNLIGVQGGDNLTATYSSSATAFSPPGNYDIVPTLLDPDDRLGNYAVTLTNGVLTVVGMPRFTSITRSLEGEVQLICEVYVGRTYEFHFKNDLAEALWVPFATNLIAVASNVTLTNISGGNPQRFYRAVDVTSP